MTAGRDRAQRRASRLVRWYPRSWRARYGEEFAALLEDDLRERPVSPSRSLDVALHGVGARLEAAGLAGDLVPVQRRLAAGVALAGIALAVFFATGVALWSQLTIGLQFGQPDDGATVTGMWLMSGALLAVVPLLALAGIPVLAALWRELRAGRWRPLLWPLVVAVWGTVVLALGSHHFGLQWPGTGGHGWGPRSLVPAPIAKVLWAGTSWFTTYWAHPRSLSEFPANQLAWMALSPFALVATVSAAALMIRRLPLTPRALRLEAALAALGCAAMIAFLTGATSWALDGNTGWWTPFSAGAIDYGALAVMALALIGACTGARRAVAATHGAQAAE